MATLSQKHAHRLSDARKNQLYREGGSEAKVGTAIQQRLDALALIRKGAGGDLNRASDADAERARDLLAEVEYLQTEVPAGIADGQAMVHGRSTGLGGAKAARGWKSGHWSTEITRRVKDLTPSGSVVVPSLSTGIVPIEDRPQRLLDVIPRGETLAGTDMFAYLRETVRTHNAAETAPGALKPTSTYSVEKVEDRARTIATLSEPVRRQDLDDARMLAQYVEGSLRQAVMLRLDGQILNGDGTGENLEGIANTSGTSSILFATDLLTTTRKAVTALEDEEIYGGVFVLNPAQWEELELTTTPSPGGYVLGGPVDRAAQRLWGRPVVITSAQSSAAGWLIDFQGSTRLYERETVRVDWSEAPVGSVAGESAFKTNELIFRAEGRWGFAVLRPAGAVEFPTA